VERNIKIVNEQIEQAFDVVGQNIRIVNREIE